MPYFGITSSALQVKTFGEFQDYLFGGVGRKAIMEFNHFKWLPTLG